MLEKLKRKYWDSSFYYGYEIRHPELFLVSDMSQDETGLPVFIGVDEMGNWKKFRGKHYIRVENGYGNILHIRKSLKVSIEKNPKLLNIRRLKISKEDFEIVKKFISDNYDKLMRLLEDEDYTCMELRDELRCQH